MNSKISFTNMLTLKPYILFLCIATLNGVISDDCRSIQFEPQTMGMILENHVIVSSTVQNQQTCELRCYSQPDCVSYNYGSTAKNETPSCDLNNQNHLQASSSDFVWKENYIYRHVLNSCQSSPCASNATCQTGFTADGYRCICPQGYTGDHCEAGQSPRVEACASLTLSDATNSYEVNADHGTWPDDGFCRVLPGKELNARDPYTMTVELMNVIGKDGVDSGHPGVIYNVVDENNFDFVYFRPHSQPNCYQLGFLSNGLFSLSGKASCPNGSPSGGVWFTVRIVVRSDKAVDMYLNDDYLTSLTAQFDTKGRGGVLVANGYNNIIQFRKFSITSN